MQMRRPTRDFSPVPSPQFLSAPPPLTEETNTNNNNNNENNKSDIFRYNNRGNFDITRATDKDEINNNREDNTNNTKQSNELPWQPECNARVFISPSPKHHLTWSHEDPIISSEHENSATPPFLHDQATGSAQGSNTNTCEGNGGEDSNGMDDASFTMGRRAVLLRATDMLGSLSCSASPSSPDPAERVSQNEEEGEGEEEERAKAPSPVLSQNHLVGAGHRFSNTALFSNYSNNANKKSQHSKKTNDNNSTADHDRLAGAVEGLHAVIAELTSEVRELRVAVLRVAKNSVDVNTASVPPRHSAAVSRESFRRSEEVPPPPPSPETNIILNAVQDGLRELEALPSYLPPGHRAIMEEARRRC